MQNIEHFLNSMQSLNPDIQDEIDAVEFAMTQVPKVDNFVWFGSINNMGVYYANSRESRWFPGYTTEMAANFLASEML